MLSCVELMCLSSPGRVPGQIPKECSNVLLKQLANKLHELTLAQAVCGWKAVKQTAVVVLAE